MHDDMQVNKDKILVNGAIEKSPEKVDLIAKENVHNDDTNTKDKVELPATTQLGASL